MYQLTDDDTFNMSCRAIFHDGEPVAHVEKWDLDSPETAERALAHAKHLIAGANHYASLCTAVQRLLEEAAAGAPISQATIASAQAVLTLAREPVVIVQGDELPHEESGAQNRDAGGAL